MLIILLATAITNLSYFMQTKHLSNIDFPWNIILNIPKFTSLPDWSSIYTFSAKQGISAIVWDAIQQSIKNNSIKPEQYPSKAQKIQWGLSSEAIELKYARQKAVIIKLSRFFEKHGIKMMILKGYGLSLNYPIPNHRPCGDIDIWLFEEIQSSNGRTIRVSAQQKADQLLSKYFNIDIDEDKHHHTVFYIDGVMIENHYDFLNIHAHSSNKIIEQSLQKLIQQDMDVIDAGGSQVYLPTPDFHALFMLRHSASHFAAEHIAIRHLLDWRYFLERYTNKINWPNLIDIAKQMNMYSFLNCINAICIDYLQLPVDCVPAFERDASLEQRVWNEILQPEFKELKPKNAGYIRSWSFMIRRWWANRWKHRIVYRESLIETFLVQIWSHILKPKSLKL